MGWRYDLNGHKAGHETLRACSKICRWWFRMASTDGLFLLMLLTGCRSAQDGYLTQATDHATAVELEQVLGHPSHEQVLETGQRLWPIAVKGAGQAAGISRRSVKISG